MNNNSALRVSKKRGRNAVIKSFGRGMNSRLDSAILPIDVAEFAYNYQFNSGVLKDGFGVTFSKLIDRNPIDGQVLAVWIFNQRVPEQKTFCMLASKEGDVYQRELNSSDDFVLIEGIQLTSRPLSLTYRLNGDDVMIITSPTDGMFVWDGVKQAQKIESVPLILSMTVHFERLFVTTADYPDAVWFSQDLDPTNFGTDINEGGFIELIDERGAPLTALSYQNYVFIFREFGITKLTAFGAQEDFTASNLFVSSGRIYSRTVALCGDSVMFLASDGLYAFDGLVTQRILDNITKLILPSPNATAIFSEGKYYLSLLMQFGDCEQIGCENAQYCNNALIVVDIHTGQYSISRGFDIVDMVFVQQSNQVLGIMNDGSVGIISAVGAFFDQPLKKVWRIGMQDLDEPTKRKNIKQIDIHTKQDLELVLRTDRTSRIIKVKGKNTVSRVPLNIQCKLFSMDIVSYSTDVNVSRPALRIVSVG